MFPTELVALNFAVDEYASDRGVFPSRKRESRQVIYVATMEKAHGVNFLTEEGRLSEIGTQYLFKINIFVLFYIVVFFYCTL